MFSSDSTSEPTEELVKNEDSMSLPIPPNQPLGLDPEKTNRRRFSCPRRLEATASKAGRRTEDDLSEGRQDDRLGQTDSVCGQRGAPEGAEDGAPGSHPHAVWSSCGGETEHGNADSAPESHFLL